MKEIVLKVEGMVCNGCSNRIENALKTIDGVSLVKADYATGVVTVNLEDNVSLNVIKEKIEDIGFNVLEED